MNKENYYQIQLPIFFPDVPQDFQVNLDKESKVNSIPASH